MSARAQRSTPSVIEKAATSAATPMTTPVVESVVRVGLVRKESAPTLADSINAAEFTLKRLISFRSLVSPGSRRAARRKPEAYCRPIVAAPGRALQSEYADRL